MKLYQLVLLSTPVFINFAAIGLTNIDVHNNYSAPINYAVDSSPQEAVKQFNTVKNWMEVNNLTNGNSCVFIKTNPNCKLDNYYNHRILLSIKESNTVNVNNTTAVSNLSLKLNERFVGTGNKGSQYNKMPINFNLYLRWKNLALLGWFIDLICWGYLVGIWIVICALNT